MDEKTMDFYSQQLNIRPSSSTLAIAYLKKIIRMFDQDLQIVKLLIG